MHASVNDGSMLACMHLCMMDQCMHACMHVGMHACMHVCMYVCMRVCECMHVCMYACICLSVYPVIHPSMRDVHTRAHIDMYMNIQIVLHQPNQVRAHLIGQFYTVNGGGTVLGASRTFLALGHLLVVCISCMYLYRLCMHLSLHRLSIDQSIDRSMLIRPRAAL